MPKQKRIDRHLVKRSPMIPTGPLFENKTPSSTKNTDLRPTVALVWKVFEAAAIVAAIWALFLSIDANDKASRGLKEAVDANVLAIKQGVLARSSLNEARKANDIALEANRQSGIVNSWQTLTNPSPGNSGKKRALEYLYNAGESLWGIDLSCERMGVFDKEKNVCIRPVVLHRLEFSTNHTNAIAKSDFSFVDFQSAKWARLELLGNDFKGSNFSNAQLLDVNFYNSDLTGASFYKAELMGKTKFEGSNVSGAEFCLGGECAGFHDETSLKGSWYWSDDRPDIDGLSFFSRDDRPIECKVSLRREYILDGRSDIPLGCRGK